MLLFWLQFSVRKQLCGQKSLLSLLLLCNNILIQVSNLNEIWNKNNCSGFVFPVNKDVSSTFNYYVSYNPIIMMSNLSYLLFHYIQFSACWSKLLIVFQWLFVCSDQINSYYQLSTIVLVYLNTTRVHLEIIIHTSIFFGFGFSHQFSRGINMFLTETKKNIKESILILIWRM